MQVKHFRLCEGFLRHVSDGLAEIKEYVFRDVLNCAMGNTDNHGRNTAVMKRSDGSMALTPLYDFAPMILDADTRSRYIRWFGETTQPDWGKVADGLVAYGIDQEALRSCFKPWADIVENLPDTMRRCGVDDDLVQERSSTITEVAKALRSAAL